MIAQRSGFTIVELLIIVAVVAILAAIVIVVFAGAQRRSVDAVVASTVSGAQKTLQIYQVFNRYYPSNIADTDYSPPLDVAVVLYTDSPQTPVYSNLTSEQNAQLFLNACNGFMPIASGGTTYNTACVYSGNNQHIAGTIASNVVIQGPTITQSDFVLRCGAACDAAQASIINSFLAQGGSFPITVPKKSSTLPAPTNIVTGNATTYCVEGRSPQFPDIVYHATPNTAARQPGPCDTTGLHYP